MSPGCCVTPAAGNCGSNSPISVSTPFRRGKVPKSCVLPSEVPTYRRVFTKSSTTVPSRIRCQSTPTAARFLQGYGRWRSATNRGSNSTTGGHGHSTAPMKRGPNGRLPSPQTTSNNTHLFCKGRQPSGVARCGRAETDVIPSGRHPVPASLPICR